MAASMHPLASQPLPIFIPSPSGPDYLLIGMALVLVVFVLGLGIIYLRLHALPDQIVHKSQKIQYEIVCVLGLIAMFTHVHAFWIAGLLLAMIDIPDFTTPLRRISGALDRIAASRQRRIAVSLPRAPFSLARDSLAPAAALPQRPGEMHDHRADADQRALPVKEGLS